MTRDTHHATRSTRSRSRGWVAAVGTGLAVLSVSVGVVNQSATPAAAAERMSCFSYLERGFGALGAADPVAAEAAYREALQLATTDELRFNSLFGLGSALAAQGRLDDALSPLQAAVEVKPDRAMAWVTLAGVRQDLGDLAGAASDLERAIVADPSLHDVVLDLGRLYSMLGRHADAELTYSKGLARWPRDQELMLGLGVARYNLSKLDGAEAAFRAVLAVDADHPRAHYGLALALLARGDRTGAENELKILDDLDPSLAERLRSEIDRVK